ncbi:hypothetical protein [Streptomyces fulvoviolaceus]|uniref:hypothetical protein n=1 Tax=Streptomyces fulvoviolaceus TaxID=285535 RepID=UPI0004C86BE2|nr:hypothetical protein [Streptomyces fulvoviolaceus]MCT9082152.1 hypothetical protein [Streptomyces fulvoviolaceus]
MESQIVLEILGAASVVSVFLYVLTGLLDQIRGLLRSWDQVRQDARALRRGVPPEDGDSR